MLVASKSHAALLPAGSAVVLAAAAAVALQLSALAVRGPEGITEALWVLGWALAVWSALSAVSAIVVLVRRRRRSTDSAFASVVLVGAAAALLAMTAMLHPFAGIGWAAA